MFPNRIMYLFCYYFMMMKQGDINSAYYQAAGLWWEGKMRSLVEAVLNLGLNIILGKHFGVAGILLATIISWTCVAIYGSKFVFTKYFKNGMFWKYWLDLIVYMFVTAFVGFCSYQIMRLLTDSQYNNVTTIIIGVVICLTIPNVLFFLIYGISRTNRLYMKKGLNLIKVVLKI